MRFKPKKTKDVFNLFDDRSFIVGLERKEGETNIELHNRIINKDESNSTFDGLAKWVQDAFDSTSENNVFNSYVFTCNYIPLSYSKYEEIYEPEESYTDPYVYDYTSGATYNFSHNSSLNNDKRDVSATVSGRYWTLYKDPDGSYSKIWIASYAPSEVKLVYQTIIDDDIYVIEESPRRDHA